MTTVTELKGNVKLSSDAGATTTIGGDGIKFDTLTTDNSTGTQGLYTNKTAGTLNIATVQTSGNINIGGVGSTTTIKGTGQVDTGLTVSGTGIKCENIQPVTALNTIVIGSGSAVTIDDTLRVATINGYNLTTTMRIGNILTTGDIQLGNSQTLGTITMGSAGSMTTIQGNLTVNKPITPGYTAYPITTNTQIGYREQPTITWTALANTTISTSSSLPIGNYSMTFSMTNTGAYIPNYVSFGGTAGGVLANYRVPWVLSDTSFSLANGAYIFTVSTAGTITLVNRAANSQSGGDSNWTIIRIS